MTHLFEGFVVDEARSILWDLKLALLDMLAELPGAGVSRGMLLEDGEAHMVRVGSHWGFNQAGSGRQRSIAWSACRFADTQRLRNGDWRSETKDPRTLSEPMVAMVG